MTDEEKLAVKATLEWLQGQTSDELLLAWLTLKKQQIIKSDYYIPNLEDGKTIL